MLLIFVFLIFKCARFNISSSYNRMCQVSRSTRVYKFKIFFLFKKIKKTLDPRKYNGGIFIGLNSPVIKSHGGADALAFYYSIKLSAKILRGNLIKKIKLNIEND